MGDTEYDIRATPYHYHVAFDDNGAPVGLIIHHDHDGPTVHTAFVTDGAPDLNIDPVVTRYGPAIYPDGTGGADRAANPFSEEAARRTDTASDRRGRGG
jgi:hypothetical protein